MARVCAEDSYAHALRRETFGKPLIANQVILAKFAGFARAIEPVHAYMESLVYIIEHERRRKFLARQDGRGLGTQSAEIDNEDINIGGLTATLKTSAGRALEHVNREAQQIMGGAGYARSGKGARIEQISRDVRVMVVGGGSEEILSELAVKLEGKEMQAFSKRLNKL
jgi:alkylation response protein AidB-like acyl-CoA dehydrogenase